VLGVAAGGIHFQGNWLVGWGNSVHVWQSKSLLQCMAAEAFCADFNEKAVHTSIMATKTSA